LVTEYKAKAQNKPYNPGLFWPYTYAKSLKDNGCLA